MYERMLDKRTVPTIEQIIQHIGKPAFDRLYKVEQQLHNLFSLKRELKFPFGNKYGWGYKYSHRTKHLFYVFFIKDGLLFFLQIGDKQVPLLEERLPKLSTKANEVWMNRYPCGDHGGWVNYPLYEDDELNSLIDMVQIKASVQPKNQRN